MKIIKKINVLIFAIGFLTLISCELEGGESLNGANTPSISDDLSRGELPQAVAGVLSDMRVGLATQVDVQSIFGREYYFFSNADPRFEADVVTGSLDDNTFYTTTPWSARYATIKGVNLTLEGLANTTAIFTSQEVAATTGVLNTLKAHELLMVANNQGQKGIRVDVADPDNLGAFVSYDDALTEIVNLLMTAASDLEFSFGLDSSTIFPLSSGYDNLDTPEGFLKFNKALLARVEAYRGNYANVIIALNESFMDMNGDLKTGAYHTFSLTGADQANPLFIALNANARVRVAHSSFINDALTGDNRINKVVMRNTPREASGLIGTHDVWVYQSNVDNVPIIRNEELILLSAEANHITNPSAAVDAINVVRSAAGLGNYTGATTPAALVDEILFQRRYSLFGESHRWVDMRRFGKLGDLPNDRATDNVPASVPIPANENQ